MERYSFFDAQNTGSGFDRTYNSSDIAAYFSSFIGNGVYGNPANQLQVVPATGLGITIKQGKAWINGYYYELSESDKALTIERGDNNYPRIDLVVLSLNHSKRLIEIKLIKGAAAAVPQAPTFTRDKTIHELVLAEITVPAGTTDVKAAQIKDCRPDNAKCGFVTGVVEQIDTTNLFAQYDDSFKTWFEGIKGILDGDTAGNLAAEVTKLQEITNQHSNSLAEHGGQITALENRIKFGTVAAPDTGTPNTIYIQLL